MPRFELLVGSGAFWERASRDMVSAKQRLLLQAMTFEGDAAGLGVAAAINASQAQDRRVLVDDYSRHVLNDTILKLSRDPALMAEARITWAMFEGMIAGGAGLRVTNPIAGKLLGYPLRNHKKLIVADGIAWIGGINFSDHNFAWHDMMLRIEDAAVAQWLAGQFEADWQGQPVTASATFDGIDLLSLDGANNRIAFLPLLDMFAEAQVSIEVISAYPTQPFVGALVKAAERGVAVTIHTPQPNNKPVVRDFLVGVAQRTRLDVRLLPAMTHAKAALIDGHTLVLGSSNFDFVSFRTNNDYVATIRDAGLIADFTARMLVPARAVGVRVKPGDYPQWRCRAAGLGLDFADSVIARLRHKRRIAEWSRP